MFFTLCTNKDLYEWDKTGVFGSVYGELYINIDGIIFPDEGWIDIISSVLIMWIENIASLLQSNAYNEEKEFYFMDGPYYFKLIGINDEMVKITLFDHYKQVNHEPYEVSFYNFLSEVSKVIIEIYMDERLKELQNVKELQKKYAYLKKIAKNKGYKI